MAFSFQRKPMASFAQRLRDATYCLRGSDDRANAVADLCCQIGSEADGSLTGQTPDSQPDLKVGQHWYIIVNPNQTRYVAHVEILDVTAATVQVGFVPRYSPSQVARFVRTDLEFIELVKEAPECNTGN